MSSRDIDIAKQMLSDLESIVRGARRDIDAAGGLVENPAASTILMCAHALLGAAYGCHLPEMSEAMKMVTQRNLPRLIREAAR